MCTVESDEIRIGMLQDGLHEMHDKMNEKADQSTVTSLENLMGKLKSGVDKMGGSMGKSPLNFCLSCDQPMFTTVSTMNYEQITCMLRIGK